MYKRQHQITINAVSAPQRQAEIDTPSGGPISSIKTNMAAPATSPSDWTRVRGAGLAMLNASSHLQDGLDHPRVMCVIESVSDISKRVISCESIERQLPGQIEVRKLWNEQVRHTVALEYA